ncbi:unnamed protein product, partial [Ectocarpus sp. 8 AP-2014]
QRTGEQQEREPLSSVAAVRERGVVKICVRSWAPNVVILRLVYLNRASNRV